MRGCADVSTNPKAVKWELKNGKRILEEDDDDEEEDEEDNAENRRSG